MVMLYAGLRRGEAMYVDVDRDCDFVMHTLTVRGALSFTDGNAPMFPKARQTMPCVLFPWCGSWKKHSGDTMAFSVRSRMAGS